MQIVIDIPDEIVKWINDFSDIIKVINGSKIGTVVDAIKNSTPLPKGHGRLINEREVYKKFYCHCLARVAKEVLDETPTIIEADKVEPQESEDKE